MTNGRFVSRPIALLVPATKFSSLSRFFLPALRSEKAICHHGNLAAHLAYLMSFIRAIH